MCPAEASAEVDGWVAVVTEGPGDGANIVAVSAPDGSTWLTTSGTYERTPQGAAAAALHYMLMHEG